MASQDKISPPLACAQARARADLPTAVGPARRWRTGGKGKAGNFRQDEQDLQDNEPKGRRAMKKNCREFPKVFYEKRFSVIFVARM
jgi:hypothetical protein